jgi:nucleoid-associated protein YgaU
MTREHKLALVVGFGLILFVGILITDHLSADTRGHETLPTARIPDSPPITLIGRETTVLEPEVRVEVAPRVPEIGFETSAARPRELARPMRAIDQDGDRPDVSGALAGRGMATPPPPVDTHHVVRKNETLTGIAKKVYGDAGLWRRIANANPGINPDVLQPGTRLRIPAEDPQPSRTAVREAPEQTASPSKNRSYTVRTGDSLASIAERELGREGRWPEIKELNRLSSVTVFPGQSIVLPAR